MKNTIKSRSKNAVQIPPEFLQRPRPPAPSASWKVECLAAHGPGGLGRSWPQEVPGGAVGRGAESRHFRGKKITIYSWVNQLFLWPFSIANCPQEVQESIFRQYGDGKQRWEESEKRSEEKKKIKEDKVRRKRRSRCAKR